jgi:hypothetical protein
VYTPPWTLHPSLGLLQPSPDSSLLLKTLHPSFDSTSLFGLYTPPWILQSSLEDTPLLGLYKPPWTLHPPWALRPFSESTPLLGLYTPSYTLHSSLDSTTLLGLYTPPWTLQYTPPQILHRFLDSTFLLNILHPSIDSTPLVRNNKLPLTLHPYLLGCWHYFDTELSMCILYCGGG